VVEKHAEVCLSSRSFCSTQRRVATSTNYWQLYHLYLYLDYLYHLRLYVSMIGTYSHVRLYHMD
jgi:hypothetical protein